MGSVYGPNIVTDGLIMYLDAGNVQSYPGSGATWYDLSGNNYDATINGTNHWVSTDGGWFDRANDTQYVDYIALEADAAQATGAYYTIEFWMWPHTPSSTGYWNSMVTGGNDNYNIYNQQPTGPRLAKYGSGNYISYTSREKFMVSVVRNNSDTGSWYKNGVLATTMTATTVFTGVLDGGWVLDQDQDSAGGGFQEGQNYRGGFAQVRLYDRALTAAEVLQNYDAHKGRFGL